MVRVAPADRREARPFEPPPWERDAYEALQKGQQHEEEPEEVDARSDETEESPRRESEQVNEESEEWTAKPEQPVVPDNLELMLGALKAEEPEALKGAWKVAAAAAVVLVTLGMMLVVWGAVAMARAGTAGAAGVMGSAIMVLMGALFAALGAWLGMRSLRQQGVL